MNAVRPRKPPRSAVETVSAEEGSLSELQCPSQIPPSSQYLAGEVIGDRYRLVRELGRGGMGVVWVAHSLVLGVDVALKMIRASVAGQAVASRMAREAHAAARLGHPALVRVFDFGWTSRGDPYLVMELVQGETISAVLLREHRIDAIRAVQMILPIADGLRIAHDKQIVHRDIKPDNIFLATDAFGRTQPKLLDFGIAKVEANADERKLTQIGAVLGSPEYMSPEQAEGTDDVDARTDVWSLSVVLYELVTGVVPFSKTNYNALMQTIIHDEPQSLQDHAAGDASLWQVVQRGLAKQREQRWNDMTEFGEALALWLYEHGIKEDLSGNSIRAVWLDGTLAKIRAELLSSSPPNHAQVTGKPALPNASRLVSTQPRVAVRVKMPAPRRERVLVIALVLCAGIAGISATLAFGAKYNSQKIAARADSAAGAPVRAVIVDPAPGPMGQEPPNTAAPSSVDKSESDVPKPITNVSADVIVSKRQASKASPVAPTSSRKSSRGKHDFGF
jgi:eukaryotic-like serine/threonine-protein kinase